jgi:hypothetical protein
MHSNFYEVRGQNFENRPRGDPRATGHAKYKPMPVLLSNRPIESPYFGCNKRQKEKSR